MSAPAAVDSAATAPLGTASAQPRRSAGRTALQLVSTPAGAVGFLIVAFWIFMACFGPNIFGHAATTFTPGQRFQGPSLRHLFGTDGLGRDILARVFVATRLTFLLTAGAMLLGTVLGVILGTLAAILGSAARSILYQLTATAMAFPSILLALLLATLFGRSGIAAMIGLGIAGIPGTARLILNLTSSVAGMDFVASARLLGVSRGRLLRKHIIPNVAEPLVTLSIVTMGSALMMLAAISFLGIGVQLPDFDWGGMISQGMADIYTTPWTVLAPATAIVSAGIGFNLFGEKVAELLDPRGVVATSRSLERRAEQAPAGPGEVVEPTHGTATLAPLPDDTVVAVQGLHVYAGSGSDRRELLKGVDLVIRRGERVGIVGESGSGKSLTVSALAHMLPGSLTAEMDRHSYAGTDLRPLSVRQLRRLIGSGMPMIFQDPMSSLNPALSVGRQMRDKLEAHTKLRGAKVRQTCVTALESVHIPEAVRRVRQYPHELSGGQRQRVMIAMATLGDPHVILADEPTTALDVSVQAQVVRLLREINARDGVAIVLVSHDLALISQVCERVVVMYDGRIVEEGPVRAVVGNPQHPYTKALLGAVPDLSLGKDHELTTITDYSWNSDEYRAAHPVPRHEGVALAPGATAVVPRREGQP